MHGVRWVVCEADNSPPSSAKVKNMGTHSSTHPLFVFMVCIGITLPFVKNTCEDGSNKYLHKLFLYIGC